MDDPLTRRLGDGWDRPAPTDAELERPWSFPPNLAWPGPPTSIHRRVFLREVAETYKSCWKYWAPHVRETFGKHAGMKVLAEEEKYIGDYVSSHYLCTTFEGLKPGAVNGKIVVAYIHLLRCLFGLKKLNRAKVMKQTCRQTLDWAFDKDSPGPIKYREAWENPEIPYITEFPSFESRTEYETRVKHYNPYGLPPPVSSTVSATPQLLANSSTATPALVEAVSQPAHPQAALTLEAVETGRATVGMPPSPASSRASSEAQPSHTPSPQGAIQQPSSPDRENPDARKSPSGRQGRSTPSPESEPRPSQECRDTIGEADKARRDAAAMPPPPLPAHVISSRARHPQTPNSQGAAQQPTPPVQTDDHDGYPVGGHRTPSPEWEPHVFPEWRVDSPEVRRAREAAEAETQAIIRDFQGLPDAPRTPQEHQEQVDSSSLETPASSATHLQSRQPKKARPANSLTRGVSQNGQAEAGPSSREEQASSGPRLQTKQPERSEPIDPLTQGVLQNGRSSSHIPDALQRFLDFSDHVEGPVVKIPYDADWKEIAAAMRADEQAKRPEELVEQFEAPSSAHGSPLTRIQARRLAKGKDVDRSASLSSQPPQPTRQSKELGESGVGTQDQPIVFSDDETEDSVAQVPHSSDQASQASSAPQYLENASQPQQTAQPSQDLGEAQVSGAQSTSHVGENVSSQAVQSPRAGGSERREQRHVFNPTPNAEKSFPESSESSRTSATQSGAHTEGDIPIQTFHSSRGSRSTSCGPSVSTSSGASVHAQAARATENLTSQENTDRSSNVRTREEAGLLERTDEEDGAKRIVLGSLEVALNVPAGIPERLAGMALETLSFFGLPEGTELTLSQHYTEEMKALDELLKAGGLPEGLHIKLPRTSKSKEGGESGN